MQLILGAHFYGPYFAEEARSPSGLRRSFSVGWGIPAYLGYRTACLRHGRAGIARAEPLVRACRGGALAATPAIPTPPSRKWEPARLGRPPCRSSVLRHVRPRPAAQIKPIRCAAG